MNVMDHRNLFFTIFVMATCLFPVMAKAETSIAVVNIQQIMSESKAAKSIQKQLETHKKSFQEEFSKHERELMEEEKAIIEARSELSQEEFTKKRQEFENQLLETRKLVQKRQRSLEKAASEALAELRTEVTKIVAEISSEAEYDLVLTRQNVILVQKEMDITESVMKKLDKAMGKVDLKIETN